ncbi:MAG: triphosphoribosyl-dephospho-CoA synthase [Planctomycetota bacterium]|nr:triphosphoribosyl-dephospho-CoA synthase [Planctomycetota bacterium]
MSEADSNSSHSPLSIAQCASLAAIFEATAPKPGNVHRGADFVDLTYPDLVLSAIAIEPAMQNAVDRSLGQTVLDAVTATRQLISTNSNLGIILLIAPLSAVPRQSPLREGVKEILRGLTATDCQLVYRAICAAKPGGVGKVAEGDIAGPAPDDLVAAMKLAADRDLVARQYATNFADLFDMVLPALLECAGRWSLSDAIVRTFLQVMHRFPDSLIGRKCGAKIAQQAADHAGSVLKSGQPEEENYQEGLADLDFWLRSDGHRRNPGTTADMIAAALFAALRDGQIRGPFDWRAW